MPLTPGTRLGAYEIVRPIGAGGMGEVYRARDTRLHRDVAIKVLPSAFVQDADRLERFGREARALAALSHPNVIAVYDFVAPEAVAAEGADSAGAGPFIVTELLEGRSLRERLNAGPMVVAGRSA
jgi:eukaryotic-like serine/threonine-protein kinase